MSRLFILGAGGHGRVVADTAEAAGHWSEVMFLDNSPEYASPDWPVLGPFDAFYDYVSGVGTEFVVALGNTRQRLTWTARLRDAGCALATVVHPRAWVSPRANVAAGSVVFALAAVNVGAVVEDAVIINTGAVVEHDCVIGSGGHICPNVSLAGNVNVGQAAWLGVGSTVRQGLKVGAGAMVAAGAVVVSDVAPGVTVMGVPARAVG